MKEERFERFEGWSETGYLNTNEQELFNEVVRLRGSHAAIREYAVKAGAPGVEGNPLQWIISQHAWTQAEVKRLRAELAAMRDSGPLLDDIDSLPDPNTEPLPTLEDLHALGLKLREPSEGED